MMFYLFNCHICRPEKSRGQKQWSTFCQTIKIQKTSTRMLTSPMSGYQGESKDARFTMKRRY